MPETAGGDNSALHERIAAHKLAPPGPEALRQTLDELLFSRWNQEFVKTEAGRKGMDDLVYGRFNQALESVVPWVARHCDLEGARLLELGFGSGSSTAAFGLFCREIKGYDIDPVTVDAARARCAHFGVTNAVLHPCDPSDLLRRSLEAYAQPDVVLLYAVLEHLTIPERLDYLSRLWARLGPGGLLVIVETPNRFTYVDRHTSERPFLHLLPDALALRCYHESGRFAFVEAMDNALRDDPAGAAEMRTRWGLGASIHEFQAALGDDLDELIVADAWDDEIKNMFPCEADEDLFARFLLNEVPEQPAGFARGVLSLILRKPGGPEDRAAARAFNDRRRTELRPFFRPPRELEGLLAGRHDASSLDELLQAKKDLEALRASTSWRITAPLRLFGRLLKGQG